MYDEIEILESSVVHPIRFFEDLYTYEKLLNFISCYKERMPDKDDPNDYYYNKLIVAVDNHTLKWEYEYETDIPGNVDEYSSTQWNKTVVTLESKFNKFTRDQFFNSKRYISENIDLTEVTKSKNYLRRIIKKLLSFYECDLKEIEIFRDSFSGPLNAIIRYIYVDLTTIAPDQNINSKIPFILSQRDVSRQLIDVNGFKLDLVHSFDTLNMKLGSNAIKLKDDVDKVLFECFLNKDFLALKSKVIHFIGEVGLINTIISKIIIESKNKLADIETLKIIQINGFYFVATKSSKEKSRLTARNEYVQSIIEDHLDEFKY